MRRRGRTVNLKVRRSAATLHGTPVLTPLAPAQFMRAQLASNLDDPEATCTRIGIITAKVRDVRVYMRRLWSSCRAACRNRFGAQWTEICSADAFVTCFGATSRSGQSAWTWSSCYRAAVRASSPHHLAGSTHDALLRAAALEAPYSDLEADMLTLGPKAGELARSTRAPRAPRQQSPSQRSPPQQQPRQQPPSRCVKRQCCVAPISLSCCAGQSRTASSRSACIAPATQGDEAAPRLLHATQHHRSRDA